jgi:hypothetical protein
MQKGHTEITISKIETFAHSSRVLIDETEYTVIGTAANLEIIKSKAQVIIHILLNIIFLQYPTLPYTEQYIFIRNLEAIINDILYPGPIDGLQAIARFQADRGSNALFFYMVDFHGVEITLVGLNFPC